MAPSSGTSGNSLLQLQRKTFPSVPSVDDQPIDDDDPDDQDDSDMDAAEGDAHGGEGDDLGEGGDLSLATAGRTQRASRWTSRAVGMEVHVRPSPAGNDVTGDGTPARPFATVKGAVSKKKNAIERAAKPTYMYVSGTFFPPDVLSTEPHGGDTTVTVSAPENAPLIITPRDGATARFEGRARLSDIMDGGWQVHKPGGFGGHIYYAKLARPVWQLWLGDKSLTVARYPDVGRDWFEPWPKTFPLSLTSARGSAPAGYAFERGQRPPRNTSFDDYAEGTQSTGYWGGWFTTDGGDASKAIRGNRQKNAEWNKGAETGSLLDSKLAGFNFTGGILHSRMCHKTEFWHPLPITSHRGKRIDFRADINGKVWKGPDACTKGYRYPEKFYVEALDALNLPGEWWYDRRSQRLYVYLEGGARPDRAVGAPLMAKVNDRALDFATSENVVLRGLEFFGTFASAGTGGGGRMEGNSFQFPNYPRHILWENKWVQNQMNIKNQHFVDNDIRCYTYGAAFTGPLVHVENNLVELGIYGCGPMGCGAVFVNDASQPFVGRTTVRYTQQWHGIVWLTPGFEGAYNHVHDVSTVRDDASNFQTKYEGEYKSHMHHNWAYNSDLKGVRYDTCGGRSQGGHPQCAGAVWNNVFFNMHQGGNIKGDYQLVVGNTAFGNGQRVDLTLPAGGVGGTEDGFIYNEFSRTHNNAVDILSKHDGRCNLPLPGVSSSHNYAAGCRQDNAQATTPMKDLMRDPFNFDFRPKDRRYPAGLLQGAKRNVPKFETVDGRKIDVSEGPDLGAYQHGSATYWIPGKMFVHPSTPVPPHTTTTARADLDLMFLEGRGAARHDVYLSRNACSAWEAGRNSQQHVARLSGSNIVRNGVLGDLQAAVWYYWRVDAVAEDGTVRRGPLWCFAVGAGEGGCDSPPCSDVAATGGQACATDGGGEDPIVPAGCGSPPATTEPPPTPPPAPETTMAPPETPATTAAECRDTHWKCTNQWKNRCWKQSVKNACPLTCGECTAGPATTTAAPTTAAPTTPTAECRDTHWKCTNQWKNKCWKQSVKNACPLTCGECTATPATTTAATTTPTAECRDTHRKCTNQWKNKCWRQSVRTACPLTCGDCTA